MKCKKCGFENPEESKFCGQCGYPLEASDQEQDQDLEQDQNQDQKQDDVFSGKKKTKAKKIWLPIGAAIIILAIVVGVIAGNSNLFKSDEQLLLEAMYKTGTLSSQEVSGSLEISDVSTQNLSLVQQTLIESLSKQVKVDYDIAYNKSQMQYQIKSKFLLNDTDIVNLYLYIDTDMISIKVPELYENMLYIRWEDLPGMLESYGLISQEEADELDVENLKEQVVPYLEAMDVRQLDSYSQLGVDEFLSDLYKDMAYMLQSKASVSDSFENSYSDGEVTVDGDDYVLDVQIEDFYDTIFEFVTNLMKNEATKTALEEIVDRLSETMIEEEDVTTYNLLSQLEVSTSDTTMETWDDGSEDQVNAWAEAMKSDLEANYDTFVNQFLESVNTEEFAEEQEEIKDYYRTIDYVSHYYVEDGMVKVSEAEVTYGKEFFEDMFQENPYIFGYNEAEETPSLSLTLKAVNIYQNPNEEIVMDDLEESAEDVSQMDIMDIMNIATTISSNASELLGDFGSF